MRGATVLGIMLAATGCKQIFDLEPPALTDSTVGCGWRAVAAGSGHSCALDPQGRVWCWGGNWVGQSAPGANNPVLEPGVVALPRAAVELVAGKMHTCARLAD